MTDATGKPRVAGPPMPAGAEIVPLPMRKVVQIAWQGLRIRFWRSMLVVGGIILAIAFLTYILCSDAMARRAATAGSAALVERLTRDGVLDQRSLADQRVQTYWTVGIALLISFVGIVNAMLMSVTERFREIGTMKCLGALDGFVLRLFLLESAMEGMAGTVIGLLVGLALSAMEGLSLYGGETWRLLAYGGVAARLSWCFVAGVVLSILGALYPAREAARMSPVAALRTEV